MPSKLGKGPQSGQARGPSVAGRRNSFRPKNFRWTFRTRNRSGPDTQEGGVGFISGPFPSNIGSEPGRRKVWGAGIRDNRVEESRANRQSNGPRCSQNGDDTSEGAEACDDDCDSRESQKT